MKKNCNGWTIKWRKKVVICAERLGACVEGSRKKMPALLRISKQNKASREHLKENHDDHQKWLEREKFQNL
jgi:hypothetical protein